MLHTRRTLIKAASLLLPAVSVAATLQPTQKQTAGPFYPASMPLDADADLVQVKGRSRPATGVVSHLSGRLLDQNGCPIKQAKLKSGSAMHLVPITIRWTGAALPNRNFRVMASPNPAQMARIDSGQSGRSAIQGGPHIYTSK